MMKVNDITIIKKYEGCKLEAYQCPAGVWTISYGHTQGVKQGDKITQDVAESMLKCDIESFEKGVSEYVHVRMSQNEFDAFVSLTFNIGINAFKRSTLLNKFNMDDRLGCSLEFTKWHYAGGKPLLGLLRRRAEEMSLFLS